MPRAIWSGALSFGLVNAPVRMFAVIHEQDVHFHLLHEPDSSPIHYRKVCEAEGKEVPHDSIDPVVFERSYYLGPAEGAEHVYALLARALEKAGLVAIATFVFHDRDQLACLRVRDRALVLERMYLAEEIRPLDGVLPGRTGRVGVRELKLAIDLIERMKGTFDLDSYRDALRDIIKRKRKGEKIKAPKPVERRGPPDLMDALEASLAAAVERGRSRMSKRELVAALSDDD